MCDISRVGGYIARVGGSIAEVRPRWRCFDWCDIATTCPNGTAWSECTCSCVCIRPLMQSWQYVSLCFYWEIYRPLTSVGGSVPAMAIIKCNTSTVYCCAVCGSDLWCMGCWGPLQINCGDSVHGIVCAVVTGVDEYDPASATIQFWEIADSSGFFMYGSTSQIYAYTNYVV